MNFKFNELSKVLFNQDGWKPVLIYFIYQMGLGVFAFVGIMMLFFDAMFSQPIATENFPAMGPTAVFGVIFILILLVVSIFLTPLFTAGLVGSTEEIRQGKGTSTSRFFQIGKERYGKTLGYLMLYMIITFGVIFVSSIILAIIGVTESSLLVYNLFLFVVVFPILLISPIAYTASLTGSAFGLLGQLYKENAGVLIIIFIALTVSAFIPLLSMITSIFMLVFPTYLVVLLVDEVEPKVEEPTTNEGINIEKE